MRLKDVPVWGTVFEGRIFPVPPGSKRAEQAAPPAPTRLVEDWDDAVAAPSLEMRTLRKFATAPSNRACDLAGLARAAALAYAENVAAAR